MCQKQLFEFGGVTCGVFEVGEDGDTSNYIQNSEWTLVHLHADLHIVYYSCCAQPYPDITYVIQVRFELLLGAWG